MPKTPKLTNRQIEDAIRKCAGNISQAARALNCSRGQIYNRVNASPGLTASLADIREELVDIAESALRREVEAGNITAIIWTLKASREAKARGWGERQEIAGADAAPIKITEIQICRPEPLALPETGIDSGVGSE